MIWKLWIAWALYRALREARHLRGHPRQQSIDTTACFLFHLYAPLILLVALPFMGLYLFLLKHNKRLGGFGRRLVLMELGSWEEDVKRIRRIT